MGFGQTPDLLRFMGSSEAMTEFIRVMTKLNHGIFEEMVVQMISLGFQDAV